MPNKIPDLTPTNQLILRRHSGADPLDQPQSAVLRAAFAAAQKMPRLHHRRLGRRFDPKRSRVFTWIGQQPEVRAWLFAIFSSSRAIVFDPATREWRGKEVP